MATVNQYSLHTGPQLPLNFRTVLQLTPTVEEGCTRPAPAAGLMTGSPQQADCWNQTNYNTGCITVETQPNNYGAGFAAAGGGAYAVQWADDAIRFWFFQVRHRARSSSNGPTHPDLILLQRNAIPADFASGSPQPGNWGLPSGIYPQATCDFASHFGPQSLILDIDLCGLYAGEPAIFLEGGSCTGLCTDLIHDPTNFNTAYFEIEFLRIFTE